MQSPPKWLYVAIGIGCAVLAFVTIGFSSDLTRSTAENILRKQYSNPSRSAEYGYLSLTSQNSFDFDLRYQKMDGVVYRVSQQQVAALNKLFNDAVTATDRDYDRLRADVASQFDNNFKLFGGEKSLDELRWVWRSKFVKGFEWQLSRKLGYNLILTGYGILGDDLKETCIRKTENPSGCDYVAANSSIDQVTGIIGSDREKRVEYQVRIKPTEFAKRVAAAKGAPTPEERLQGRVSIFIKYDDGWRPAF